jgi:ferric-dicitrate binding protein FerR (iron transport regulator)
MVQLFSSRLVTYDRSAEAVIGDALVDVAPCSILDVRRNGPYAASVSMSYGEASFDVVPSGRRRFATFEVHSGDLLILATDARFSVRSWRDHSRVSVDRGIVELEVNGRRLTLSAGDRWPTAFE